MNQLLQVSSLSRAYRSGEVETRALDSVSFEVAAGEFVALMGPSGCGKSTLLNILGFLDAPDEGSYRLRGEEVATLSEARLTRLRRAHAGFVFQSFNLIDELNVAENVEVALLYRGADARRRRVEAVLDQVGLAHRARHRPRQLSGGQQQRVAIARALAPEPDLLLADEPTGNLDSANGAAVMDLLKSAAAGGTTVIMVTHSALHAAAADRTIRMLDGRIVGETRL
ncbi:MAG: ABC transporter ATP-binding protein [Alphaproteobacteria bacterium]|nr:ABC transporter ATP-binding protein [Alphaproteobacteria bacterium]MBV9370805.1 ABC transporter ATP-binding protein [Alphaproteobacteria bacterium]MBV9900115.1 ABC transporter ATP-binding protein [Alphaproteobacteria bacterium]